MTNYEPPLDPQPSDDQPAPKEKRRWLTHLLWGIGVITALTIGLNAAEDGTAPAAAVEQPTPKTITETVEVEVPGEVPQGDVDALDKRASELDDLEADIDARKGSLDKQKTELDERATALDKREASISAAEETEPVETEEDADSAMTTSQEQAVKSAADYLGYSSFSRTGLIQQLEFEGFNNDDAVYGVDAQQADWNEQAAISAKDYLDYSSFSRASLIEQLVFEGFTQAEAEYGVTEAGL